MQPIALEIEVARKVTGQPTTKIPTAQDKYPLIGTPHRKEPHMRFKRCPLPLMHHAINEQGTRNYTKSDQTMGK